MKISTLIFTATLLFTSNICAQEILVVSEEWPGATEKSSRGLYWDIMRAVYQKNETQLILKNMSYARSIKHIKKSKADIMLGSSLNELEGVLYPQTPLDVDHVYVLYRNDTIWKNQTTLTGKKVGWIRGYDYDKELIVDVDLKEFLSLSVGLRRLLRGDIDFVIDAKADLDDAIIKSRIDKAKFNMGKVFDIKTYPVFTSDDTGKALRANYDKQMTRLIAVGAIKALFDKYNWPTYPHNK